MNASSSVGEKGNPRCAVSDVNGVCMDDDIGDCDEIQSVEPCSKRYKEGNVSKELLDQLRHDVLCEINALRIAWRNVLRLLPRRWPTGMQQWWRNWKVWWGIFPSWWTPKIFNTLILWMGNVWPSNKGCGRVGKRSKTRVLRRLCILNDKKASIGSDEFRCRMRQETLRSDFISIHERQNGRWGCLLEKPSPWWCSQHGFCSTSCGGRGPLSIQAGTTHFCGFLSRTQWMGHLEKHSWDRHSNKLWVRERRVWSMMIWTCSICV